MSRLTNIYAAYRGDNYVGGRDNLTAGGHAWRESEHGQVGTHTIRQKARVRA